MYEKHTDNVGYDSGILTEKIEKRHVVLVSSVSQSQRSEVVSDKGERCIEVGAS